MADTSSTRQLVEKYKSGDHAAGNVLIDRYLPRLIYLVRVRLGAKLRRRVESGDIAQEALLKSLRSLRTFTWQGDDAFLRYLKANVERVIRDAVDHATAQKRNVDREEPLLVEGIDSRMTKTASEQFILKQDLERLAQVMDELAEQKPEAWELIVASKVEEGRSYKELADEAGATVGAIKSRVKRAMHHLCTMYESRFGEGDNDHANR